MLFFSTFLMNINVLQQAANEARGLAMDAVAQCKSGHLGLPLGCADLGAVLFSETLSFNPDEPKWLNRDRFVLSAGHGSMFLYAWLHLSGFSLSLEDVKNFRQLHSKTPGHPEFGHTEGVECTTGPLGQGIGNAVGLAMAAKMGAARYNTKDFEVINHHVIALCGDGCMQEGVAAEASALAGHLGLDNLILIYDANEVTLDAMASKSQSEDTTKRYEAYGFDTITIDGHDMEGMQAAFTQAKANKNGKPKLIIIKTLIGKGIKEIEGSYKAHGEAGVKFVAEARKHLGLPEERFYVSEQTRKHFQSRKDAKKQAYELWLGQFKAWEAANPALAEELKNAQSYHLPANLTDKVPEFDKEKPLATRDAGSLALQALAQACPLLISGSADLHGSTKNYIQGGEDFSKTTPQGRNMYFGIREHAMGAILNGFGYYGLFRASGATFLTFSDYMRPAVRLAALSKLPVFYIWTHDSVGVGEDGPTHQPVETVSSLRLIPNLDVIRPADAEETAGAFIAALERLEGPTALILSRQALPPQNALSPQSRRVGTLKGAYIAKNEEGPLERIIIATGSELQHAIKAAERLGKGVRVVSMPCCERFDRQEASYKETILPSTCKNRIAIEAGVGAYWHKYVGLEGKIISIDQFGLSGPGNLVMDALGINEASIL
jgi:transketolase